MRNRFSLMILVCMVAVLLCSCSFAKPEKTMVLNLAAQNSGFLLAKEKPSLARGIQGYSKNVLEIGLEGFTKFAFDEWVVMVMHQLKVDPLLQMNFKEMVKLVNIEIALSENSKDTVDIIYNVIQNFIVGIKAAK